VTLTNTDRPIEIFPRSVERPCSVTGPIRVESSGSLSRDLVPGGTDLPAYTFGWIEPDHTVIWDVLPLDGASPQRLQELLILSSGVDEPPGLRYRLLAILHNQAVGWRTASFSGEVAPMEGLDMEVHETPSGLVEPVTIADTTERAASLLERLVDDANTYGVIVDGAGVVGVVDQTRLTTAPEGAAAVDVTVREVAIVDADTAIDDIAAVVAALPDTGRGPGGAIVMRDGRPTGFVPRARIEALASSPTDRDADLGGLSGLAGAPLSTLVFECAAHGESATIAYYDPSNPPRCTHGDLMRRRRES
jgi:hypothetical protein